MSIDRGRAYGQGGGVANWKSRQPTGVSSLRSSDAAGVYPNKYLKSEAGPGCKAAPIGQSRAAPFSLSLLFPIVILLMLSVTVRNEDIAEAFDWQLGVRVVGYAMAAISVLLALGTRKLPINRLIFAWALIPVFLMGTALYAPDWQLSFISGLAHLILLFFAWRLVTHHGTTPVVLAIIISGLIICALSVIAYYAFPEIGRSTVEAYTADPGGRMRGVTPQPNTLGAVAAFTALLSITYFQRFTAPQRAFAAVAILFAAFCLFYSDSRTSIATLAICLLLWWLRRTNVALNLFTFVAIALAATMVVTFVPDVSVYVTRGEAGPTDLSSLNGRSRIWDVAWESIHAHPLLGQGYGASRLILPMDDRLFGAAVNTHNVYMELLFCGGAVLFGIFLLVVAASVARGAMLGRTEALIALLFFLIRGAAEAAPFAGLPLFIAFIFYAAVAMCVAPSGLSPEGAARFKLLVGNRRSAPLGLRYSAD